MTEGIKIVYILSSGRSGTTLTDLLLGSHPEMWTLGEAQLLPYEWKEQRAPCGCGAPIVECDFWRDVIPNIPLKEGRYPIGYFRESHTQRKTLRWWEAMSLLTGGITVQQERAAHSYGRVNARYFSAVREEVMDRGHSIKWLVDASKGPYRLYWLFYSGKFELKVIHLTKDPRAYVYSIARRQNSYTAQDVVRWAVRWMLDNLIQSALIQWHLQDEQFVHLRYEEVASMPGDVLSSCAKWLNLNEDMSGGASVIREYANHAVSGNEMRWKDTRVELDERWKRELEERHKRIVWWLTGWLATSYGYNS